MSSLTLAKDERLKRGDFRSAQWLKCSETTHFSLLIRKNKYERRRIAITIRKQVGHAVLRNRIRRLIKECYRLNKDAFVEGHDNLVKVKKVPFVNLNLKEVSEELIRLLKTRRVPVSIA